MVLNNDLAPTFAAIAGVEPPSFVDRRSFLKLLTKPDTPWRRSFLIERRQMETHELSGKAIIDGIRTAKHTYVEYGTGERELYDLRRTRSSSSIWPGPPTSACFRRSPTAG